MPHRITPAESGQSFVAADEDTILDAALKHGRPFPYGCRNGSCGACKARVLQGTISYGGRVVTALDDAERAAGWCLCCQARAESDILIEVREVYRAGSPEVRTLPARVAQRRRLNHDVMGLWLQLPRSERLCYLAGQYIDILMGDGRRRSFSLANPPHDDALLELHIRHYDGGVFSDHVFNRMRDRELLRIRGPYGNFFLREESGRPMLFVAGGTGFAPIKGIIEHALAEGVTRPLRLYWGVRAVCDIYMQELALRWAAVHPNLAFVPVLSEPRPEDAWSGRRGFVHEALAEDFTDLCGYDLYTSGPPVMVRAVASTCVARGLPPERIFSDAFEFAAN